MTNSSSYLAGDLQNTFPSNLYVSGIQACYVTKPPCSGTEVASTMGADRIKSYTGDFPSPIQIMNYHPKEDERGRTFFSDTEIRGWVRDAAAYHGVPHELLATIIQQENAPNSTKWRQFLQFGERTLTTTSAWINKTVYDVVPDAIAGGSSGFMNMKRATLEGAVNYTIYNYGKNPMPDDIRYRYDNKDIDIRIPGYDWRADLYYGAAHLRELIDRKMGALCYSGMLSLEQARDVMASYNGSGELAAKYGNDGLDTLKKAMNNDGILYFYEK